MLGKMIKIFSGVITVASLIEAGAVGVGYFRKKKLAKADNKYIAERTKTYMEYHKSLDKMEQNYIEKTEKEA